MARQRNPIVYIVDDDEAVRRALTALLSARGYNALAFESAEAFLEQTPGSAVGCLLADVRLPGMSGLDLQREMKKRGAALPIVMITGHGDVPMAVAALKAGAIDFLEKPFDVDPLIAAVEAALAPPRMTASSAAFAARVAELTPREREVMELVVAGEPNKVIAHRLKIAVRTVEIHRARVMDKTGARNLSDLVRMAIQSAP